MILEFGLPVTAAEFITAFTGWPRGLYPGTIPLLESLPRLLYLGLLFHKQRTALGAHLR